MTLKTKILLIRIFSPPPLLMLPIIGGGAGLSIFDETRGDSMPFFGMLGFASGLVIAFISAAMIYRTPREDAPYRGQRVLFWLLAFEFSILITGRLLAFVTSGDLTH